MVSAAPVFNLNEKEKMSGKKWSHRDKHKMAQRNAAKRSRRAGFRTDDLPQKGRDFPVLPSKRKRPKKQREDFDYEATYSDYD